MTTKATPSLIERLRADAEQVTLPLNAGDIALYRVMALEREHIVALLDQSIAAISFRDRANGLAAENRQLRRHIELRANAQDPLAIALRAEVERLREERDCAANNCERESRLKIQAQSAKESAERRIAELEALLKRYRTETPLGHQPHMIAHKVDEILAGGMK